MARRLAELPETRRGRKPKYPWDEWEDGSVWEILHGVDYQVSTASMQTALYVRARHRGLRVQTRRLADRDGLCFVFSRNSAQP